MADFSASMSSVSRQNSEATVRSSEFPNTAVECRRETAVNGPGTSVTALRRSLPGVRVMFNDLRS